MRRNLVILMLCVAVCVPLVTRAQTESTQEPNLNTTSNVNEQTIPDNPASLLAADGIMNCRTGKYSMDVGSLRAQAGAHVPVADYTTEMNTGYLVYKFCTLDPLVRKIAEGITSGLGRLSINGCLNGDEGQTCFVRNLNQFLQPKVDETVYAVLKGEDAAAMCAPFKDTVIRTAARRYMQERNNPGKPIQCPFTSCSAADQKILLEGGADYLGAYKRCGGLRAIYESTLPGATPASALAEVEEYIGGAVANRIDVERTYLEWGNGIKSPQQKVGGVPQITTPGYIISQMLSQVLGSGYRQLENANAIDQVVGALYSGLSSQLITNPSGLVGLAKQNGSQPSYINQMVAQSSAQVRSSIVNTALNMLSTWRNVEAGYLAAQNSMAAVFNSSISQLKAAESKCWEVVVPAVQQYAQSQGGNVTVATSTAFSKAVIDASITAAATAVTSNIRTSQLALQVIDGLIADVTNNSSATVQTAAITRLQELINQDAVHSSEALQSAQTALQSVQNSMGTLVTDTLTNWGGGSGSSAPWDDTIAANTVGWCNINNQVTVQMWYQRWKK